MAESMIEKITQATLIESDIKAYQFKGGITKNCPITPFSSRYIVSLRDVPVSINDFINRDPDIRATKADFTIKYFPKKHKNRVKGKPYVIGQDLIMWRIAVSGPYHWDALCERIPELGWIKRNTTFTNDFFSIAKKHPGLMIKFTIDFPKYCAMIEKKAEEMGLNIEHRALVAYQCSSKDYEDTFSKFEIDDVKTKDDYIKEINAAESEAVQEYKGD